MSDWKKNYLDALEVPVWVPLNDSVVEETHVEEQTQPIKSSEPVLSNDAASSNEPVLNEEPEDKSPQLRLRLLHGELNAQYGFIIDAQTDLKSALVTYQQLQFAWQAWLDKPLSAALLQVVTEQESASAPASTDPQEMVEFPDFKGRLFDCGDLELLQADESQQHYISAPAFNFKQADKKAWWQLLQNLH